MMKIQLPALSLFFFAIVFGGVSANQIHAACYYISSSGSDNNGSSPAQAWRSMNKVNATTYSPGDCILFEGEQTFSGELYIQSNSAGTPLSPLLISSYGAGRATIDASTSTGIFIYNAGGFEITKLNIVGTGRTSNTADGIVIYTDLPGDIKLEHIYIDRVEVSGFGKNAIAIGGWNNQTGYRNVRVTNSSLHDNGQSGLLTYAQALNVHENVYVGYVKAYNNSGIPTATTNTESGNCSWKRSRQNY